MAGAGRSRRRAQAGLDARILRGHLQPPDICRARPQRPLLPDPVRHALVGVTASSFMEVVIDDGLVKSGDGDVERSCYCIHAPIHKALPHAKAVFHTHMPYASALTRLEDPRIKEVGQTEVGMINEIAYDDEYAGPALDPTEGARLARVISDKTILFMANHGITTVGETVADAYDRLYYVERAAQVQIYAMWTGEKLKVLPEPVVEKTKRDIGGSGMYDPPPTQRHFDALKRMLDRKEPDYAT